MQEANEAKHAFMIRSKHMLRLFFHIHTQHTRLKEVQHKAAEASLGAAFPAGLAAWTQAPPDESWASGVAHQAGHAGKALPNAHALFLIQEQRVGLDGEVVLQGDFGLQQGLQRVLGLHQPLPELVDGVLDLHDLAHETGQGQVRTIIHPSHTEDVGLQPTLPGGRAALLLATCGAGCPCRAPRWVCGSSLPGGSEPPSAGFLSL